MKDSRVDVNIKDDNGSTALHSAVERDWMDIIKLLLACDRVDRNITDKRGKTAEKIASERAKSLWNSLKKRGMLETYNAQIQDYLDRGVWKPVSMDQIKDWKADGNPLHYVSHHGVENSHSKSTPLRVVVNSATKNNHTGPSINDVYVGQ